MSTVPAVIDDRYEVLAALGEGQTGTVHLVADRERGGARVALKWLRQDLGKSPKQRESLLREFGILARLSHPAIARVHELGCAEGRHYFTLEHVGGRDIVAAVRERGAAAAAGLLVPLLRGLEHLHIRGLVHGDLKPSNVLVEGEAVKLVDLGLARRVGATKSKPGRTAPDGVSGTLAYLAPEILAGEPPGPRSDLYAVGVMLFEAIAGRLPFEASSPDAMVHAHLHAAPPELAALAEGCPPALARLVRDLLAKEPADRPASATAARERLAEELDLGEAARASDLAGCLRHPPFVGREAELGLIDDAIAAWIEPGSANGPPVVLIAGPAGIGKSRLLEEARIAAMLAGARVVRPVADAGAELGPLAPLVESPGAPPGPESTDGEPRPPDDAGGRGSEIMRQRRLAADAIEHLGRRAPTLLVLEDLHAASDAVAPILDYVGRTLANWRDAAEPRARRPRLLVLGTFRSDEGSGSALSALAGRGPIRVLHLGPLDEQQTASLAGGMLGLPRLPDPLRALLGRESGGNPLFVEEALRTLAEAGLVAPGEVAADLAAHTDRLAAAEGIASVVRRRVAALSAPARRAAEALALQREPIADALLAEIELDLSAAAVDELVSRQIVERRPGPGASVLAFRHDRLRQIVAADVDPERRRAIHRRTADALRALRASPARLAPHLIAAGDADARRTTLVAAEALVAGGSPAAATELLRALRERLGPDPEVSVRLGDAALRAAELATAIDAYEEALAAAPAGEPPVDVLRKQVDALAAAGRFDAAREKLDTALADADRAAQGRLLAVKAALHNRAGAYDDAARAARTALRALGPDGPPEALFEAHEALATAMLYSLDRGRIPEALEHVRTCLDIARARGDTAGEVGALKTLAHAHMESGALDDAAAAYEQGLQLARASGHVFLQAAITNNLGMVRQLQNDLERAESAFGGALALARYHGIGPLETRATCNWARVVAAQGDLERAVVHYRAARNEARAQGDLVIESVCLEEWGALCETLGRSAEALSHLQASLELRRQLGSEGRIARSVRAIADFWSRHGDALTALDGYRAAARQFDRLGDTEQLARVREGCLALASLPDAPPALRDALERWVEEAGSEPVRRIATETRDAFARARSGAHRAKDAPARPSMLPLLRQVLDCGAELEPLLEVAMGLAIDATGAERGFLILVEADGALTWASARNLAHETVRQPEFEVSRGIIEQAAREGRTVAVDEAVADERFGMRLSVRELGLRSVIAVPIRLRERTVGVVYLDDRRAAGRFDAAAREQLEAFCSAIAAPLATAAIATERRERIERLEAAYRDARRELAGRWAEAGIIGRSPAMLEVYRIVERVAASRAPVVIVGASGTGKELVARAIHERSDRREAPFVAENVGAIAPGLLEPILFGHEKGAFTGANEARQGLFELAHGGTLFLDEIADTSPEMQAGLLRVLQEGEVRRVGADRTRRVDVRLVCSSPVELGGLVAKGRLREDLYYRLNVVVVKLPPLRERLEDIPLLAEHFLAEAARERGARPQRLVPSALTALARHDWPGNVRELQNVLVRAAFSTTDDKIRAEHIELQRASTPSAADGLFPGVDLSRRQRVALGHLIEHGTITNGAYARVCGVSSRTALRDLADLVDKGIATAEGTKKGRVYRLADEAR